MVVSFQASNSMDERLGIFFKARVNVQLDRGLQVSQSWSSSLQLSNLPSNTVVALTAPMFVSVFFVTFWVCEIVFLMTDREMLTLTSQPIPIKLHRLWLMALLVCGFAQMGLHLSQDPCCLHSDPQRMVIQQLSFVNVRLFFIYFVFFYFVF